MASVTLDVGYDAPMPGSIFTGLRCDGDRGSLTAGAIVLQPGSSDGATVTLDRADGEWQVTDAGTGIDEFLPFGIPTYATWSTWPGGTDPVPSTVSFVGVDDGETPAFTDIDDITAQAIATIDALNSQLPEFPANTRTVAVEPDGLPLIVIESDVGGDDSISGQVFYIWLQEGVDAAGSIGWAVETAYVTQVCSRGVSTPDRTLCV